MCIQLCQVAPVPFSHYSVLTPLIEIAVSVWAFSSTCTSSSLIRVYPFAAPHSLYESSFVLIIEIMNCESSTLIPLPQNLNFWSLEL